MIALAPATAAFEGFRLLRREPKAALVWFCLWLVPFLFTAVMVAMGERVVLGRSVVHHTLRESAGRFGPFAVISIALFLLVWATTTIAAYRAVLRPEDRRYFFLRFGADEFRLAIMTVSSFLLVLVFGGVPAYLLLVLADPIMRAVPALARDIATFGALATVCVDIWLAVRLSLIPVETVAERRFHLTAYWPLTGGRFWYLFWCYVLCFMVVLTLGLAYVATGGFVFWLANPDLGAGNLLRRTGVLGLAGILTALSAGYWLVSTTIFCACQAYAFRNILADGKADVAIAADDGPGRPTHAPPRLG